MIYMFFFNASLPSQNHSVQECLICKDGRGKSPPLHTPEPFYSPSSENSFYQDLNTLSTELGIHSPQELEGSGQGFLTNVIWKLSPLFFNPAPLMLPLNVNEFK